VQIQVVQGDVLAQAADVLICPANCFLNMSGGVNGEILLRGGEEIQDALHDFLKTTGVRHVPPGTVVRTAAGSLPFRHILHTVAIDAFYGSSIELATTALENAFRRAGELEASTVALPALATGYGPLSLDEFCQALQYAAHRNWALSQTATLVLRRSEDVAFAQTVFGPR
jgi:O-acetyl-ADP-ribose deacetylase (regulator of RNase III)